ncbi:MAG: phosphatidate cytidylyltransferase [Chloroflexi bacterium]|nr:phosphatidate cytidylyltransferase [Chloroflexota bacterium]MCI0644273.1 phosphatidate cytidylyltransferase [Chloroflexota bacterium]MCI0726256.1 phosphatidate cytidylyltransferase [Chloroflexota bacterium]
MLLQRALVTFTLGPLVLFLIYLGGWFYFLPLAALLIIATIEYSQLAKKMGWQTPLWLLLPVVVVQWLLPPQVQEALLASQQLPEAWVAMALVAGFIAVTIYALWLYEIKKRDLAAADWLATVTGLFFLGWISSHFFRLRGLEEMAAQWTATAMVGTWVADSAAYVVGKTMGRHKLSPRLSPNKTIEGYVGGVVVGTVVTVGLAVYLELSLAAGIVLGLLVSAISPAGDLGISLLKRTAGVKDSGNLLPGHGGALDRIDSLVWSVTMAYYLALFMT